MRPMTPAAKIASGDLSLDLLKHIIYGGLILDRYIMVLAGGAVGSLARYLVGTAIMTRTGGRFPFGTVFINITGSFLIGLLMTLLTERLRPHPNWRLLLVVGVLCGYTTFSSFEWETLSLVKDGA